MKKLYFLFLGVALICTTACNKQLTESPKSFISPTQFYKSDNDAVQAANGVYFFLIGSGSYSLFQQELWRNLDEDCDLMRAVFNPGAENLTPTNPGSADQLYQGFYKGIYSASELIDQVPKSGSSPLKDRSVAEAKFLRALYYYYLTGLFGDAALVTDSNYSNAFVTKILPRTPVATIRAFMIKDLTEAIAVLPASYPAADQGRATIGAAQTLLTKVYLWNQDWKDAAATAAAIESSGTYVLLPNYADVFGEFNEFNQESIFEINFAINIKPSFQHAYYMPNQSVGVAPFSTGPWYRGYVPYLAFANSYDPADIRKASVVATGYNGMPFLSDATNHVTLWSGPKWWRLDGQERNSGLDIYVFRYADVLLMHAEAANESGDVATAYNMLKQVRTRAGLTTATGQSQDQLRTAIRQERGWELVGEGHRRLDLNRWGIYIETAKAAAMPEAPIRANSYQSYYNLLPIPASEIQLNPNLLPNNPGY